MFILFGFSCFVKVKLTTLFSFLVKSKLVKHEVSHTVILPPMVSVRCIDHNVFQFIFDHCRGSAGLQGRSME